MEEDNIKPQDLKAGDILLFLPNSIIGQIIVKLSKGMVSHAAMLYKDDIVAHSDMPGIVYESLEKCLKGEKGVYVRRLKNADMSPLPEIIDQYAGKGIKYPYVDLVLLGMLLITKKFSHKILKSPIFYYAIKGFIFVLNSKKKSLSMTCSQFVAQCYAEADLEIEYKNTILENQNKKGSSLMELMEKKEYAGLVSDNELTADNAESLGNYLSDFLNLMRGKVTLSNTLNEKKKKKEKKERKETCKSCQ